VKVGAGGLVVRRTGVDRHRMVAAVGVDAEDGHSVALADSIAEGKTDHLCR
jgi:hypothetical protein